MNTKDFIRNIAEPVAQANTPKKTNLGDKQQSPNSNAGVGRKNGLSRLIEGLEAFKAELYRLVNSLMTPKFNARAEQIFVLLPGLFFMLLGLSVLFVPQLVLISLACFLISFGALVCNLSLKVLALKRKFLLISNQIEARLIIEPGKVGSINNAESLDTKKVVFH